VRCGILTYQGRARHAVLHDIYGMDVDPFDCC
jgi:hypothetical protein